jgi:hypothetical protein
MKRALAAAVLYNLNLLAILTIILIKGPHHYLLLCSYHLPLLLYIFFEHPRYALDRCFVFEYFSK